ncbi:MAG: ATP-dependent zinc metalloprotease FtsH [Candidatus Omnitrophica bacterium]|nr:ATP-dependent zinc metalloprotease FtsH [Candidatus Omnitrophota bacterium]
MPPRNTVLWIVVIFLSIYLMRNFSSAVEGMPVTLMYGKFYNMVENNRQAPAIKSATLTENKVRGFLAAGGRFEVEIPTNDPDVIKLMRSNIDEFNVEPLRTFWANVFYSMAPTLFFFGLLWFFVFRGAQGGGPGGRIWSFGKSRATLVSGNRLKITFDNVAGVNEAKEELQEVVEFLKDPKKFQSLGGKIPKGVLLMGPPGCGKTLLAKAVSGEAGVPFFSLSGSDFVEMFVGVGAARVRDLFEQAKKSARSSQKGAIIFIDEIDAVGRQRFAGIGGGHDEREQTLNALLAEMDGFSTEVGVILVAATNRPDVLDPALLRPGRFDRQIVVDRPDIKGREAILKVHVKDIKLAKDMDLFSIAQQTSGFSGADLANLVNEAALLAARRLKKEVTISELEESIERVMAGPERKSKVIDKDEKKIVAYHESGHALLALLFPGTEKLHKVSIIPRGAAALGYTLQKPLQDKYLRSRNELMNGITIALGGRASEELIFIDITTGAHNDLEVVTELARRMVCDFGMSEKLGHLTFGRRHEQIFLGRDITEERNYSEQTAQEIDREVRGIVDECYRRAKDTLTVNKDKLIKLAEALIEKEVLEVKEVTEIVGIKV